MKQIVRELKAPLKCCIPLIIGVEGESVEPLTIHPSMCAHYSMALMKDITRNNDMQST